MGMYGTIGEDDFKVRGLLAEAFRAVIGEERFQGSATLAITKPEAVASLDFMVKAMEAGRPLYKGDSLNAQTIWRFGIDAKALVALFDWVCSAKDSDMLYFG